MSNLLSLLAEFDDMRRCQAVLIEGSAEEQFLRYVNLQEECRLKWLGAVQEAQRLQRELDASLQNMADLETKLFHARRLVEVENKSRREAEKERDELRKEIQVFKENVLNLEIPTDKLDFLKSYPKKRQSKNYNEKYGNDINSTGSFLSDLSITHSEDDFLDGRSSRQWKKDFLDGRPSRQCKKPRSSYAKTTYFGNKSKCSRISTERRGSQSKQQHQQTNDCKTHQTFFEIGKNDEICATTKVTIPPDGPIRTESIIETIPQLDTITPTTLTGGENGTSDDKENNKNKDFIKTPKKFRSPFKTQFYTPTAPPMPDISIFKSTRTPTVKNLIKNMREHNFITKTFIRSEICTNCQLKIRFGSLALKCKNCRICTHKDCKELVKIACVPASSGSTPMKGNLGVISDYAPCVPPKIPSIIMHCVHEVETRGLNEVGIYRVSGSDREVKSLKEKFLRGKNVPYLNNIDIHVICCCVKDFLRSLNEPLIPRNLWANFSNAVQNNINDEDKQIELIDSVDKLPQANRDTLAFLILHFQRIAECIETKMPIDNIARIFGPTIVGYSSFEPDHHAMCTETLIQFQIMKYLMHIPGEYWTKFTALDYDDHDDNQQRNHLQQTPLSHGTQSLYATPFKGTLRKERKFYATPPYTCKK